MRSQGKIERKKKSVQLRNLDAKLVYLFDPTISKSSGNVSLTTCELSEKQKVTNNNEQKQNKKETMMKTKNKEMNKNKNSTMKR